MSTIKFTLPERRETPERYDANKIVNQAISDAFHASLGKAKEMAANAVSEVPYERSKMVLVSDVLKSGVLAADIPYEVSTLGESGCAVFCLHDALTYARYAEYSELDIETVAQEVAAKGYYEPGKGTYHNLFDHMGARRATDIQEIFDALCTRTRACVTLLVRNKDYNGRSGRHFINIIYYDGTHFVVNDSSYERGLKVSVDTIFKSVDIAWLW